MNTLAILDALKILQTANRDDMVRLFHEQGWHTLVRIRDRDAVRDLIGIGLDMVAQSQQHKLF